MNRFALILCWLLAVGTPALAMAQPARPAGRHMQVALVAESGAVAPGGSVSLALEMRPAQGWHGYWRNPGDAGAEPRVEWALPEGWRVDPLQYPVPDRFTVLGLMNYVYEHDHALLALLHVPAGATPGSRITISARLDYLVCTDEVCVPEQASVSTFLVVGSSRPANNPSFAAYRRALPRPLAAEGRFSVEGGRLRLAIPLPSSMAVDLPYFYPLTLEALNHSAAQNVSRNGDELIIETEAGRQARTLDRIDGVLRIGENLGLGLAARPGLVPPAGVPVATAAFVEPAADLGTVLLALLGAVAGGLLLNIMPCVFPILSLKALSLARAGETDRDARHEALAYSAGVILTCLALGGLLLGLRAGGSSLGWAFQLQDPKVILLLLLLVTAIALNLAGLFRLPAITAGGNLAGKSGLSGAFFTGALAAFVATPCTGPFLGFALGAAMILPAAAALAVFAGLGLGLALPFLLLGFVPALRRRLPRPGGWMGRFQRILSVPMFLTAAGLAWVLWRQAGDRGLGLGLATAALLGLALWWLGRRRSGWVPLLLIPVLCIAPLTLVRTVEPPAAAATGRLAAEPFDEGRLAELRAAGTPVFLYFTADWCLTCKVNERAVLDRASVAQAFRARGIRVMVGDWTRGDEAIGHFLERHGRSGVPLYLYYPPGREPEILPQILTVGVLTALGR